MTILFVTDISPFPVTGGEKIRSHGLLKILSLTFDKIIAVTGKSENEAFKQNTFKNIDFHEFDFAGRTSSRRIARHLDKFKKDELLVQLLEKLLAENPVQVAFIDYHYYGQYIDFFRKKGIPTIYGTHNVQSQVVYQLPAVSLKNSLSITLEFFVDQLHERYYLRKADALIAVSNFDSKYYAGYISSHKIFVIPNFVLDEEYSSQYKEKQDYIIMTGNYLAYQNHMGLLWFINHIWNDKAFENDQLILAGMGSDIALEEINHTHKFSNIKALGSVKDLKPYIAEAKLSIVPILHGSGTRLKCIESMALKTQILSTTKGAEGIEHEGSIIIADTPESFKKQLISILRNNTNYTAKAFDIYKNKYSLEPNLQIFNKILKQILH
jgi:hypothetical protein